MHLFLQFKFLPNLHTYLCDSSGSSDSSDSSDSNDSTDNGDSCYSSDSWESKKKIYIYKRKKTKIKFFLFFCCFCLHTHQEMTVITVAVVTEVIVTSFSKNNLTPQQPMRAAFCGSRNGFLLHWNKELADFGRN